MALSEIQLNHARYQYGMLEEESRLREDYSARCRLDDTRRYRHSTRTGELGGET